MSPSPVWDVLKISLFSVKFKVHRFDSENLKLHFTSFNNSFYPLLIDKMSCTKENFWSLTLYSSIQSAKVLFYLPRVFICKYFSLDYTSGWKGYHWRNNIGARGRRKMNWTNNVLSRTGFSGPSEQGIMDDGCSWCSQCPNWGQLRTGPMYACDPNVLSPEAHNSQTCCWQSEIWEQSVVFLDLRFWRWSGLHSKFNHFV